MSAQTQYQPGVQKPSRRGGPLGLITFGVALLALIVASAGVVLAWRADSHAAEAAKKADILALRPTQPAPPPPAPADSSDPAPAESTTAPTESDGNSVPTLSPQTQYAVKYTGEVLTLPPKCGRQIYVDLDEPRVQVGVNISEFLYGKGCSAGDSPHINLQNGVEGSEVPAASVTPAECAEKIRASPLADNADVPIRRGQAFCIKTSLDTARNAAISWKMVVLSVTATAQDDTVGLRASAWDIPD
ncbi:hypothetical protein AB0M20_19520 [Actinoplanes sp. NPDC051633]|uniref:hypothetical protein n=1 Tax=Actinoplanes sp. NPDC051633 TaxID=3155670 RepID=UPI00342FAB2B